VQESEDEIERLEKENYAAGSSDEEFEASDAASGSDSEA
jgi:hypothetical protein